MLIFSSFQKLSLLQDTLENLTRYQQSRVSFHILPSAVYCVVLHYLKTVHKRSPLERKELFYFTGFLF